ncbi:MAG TPA: DUF3291 domain-containing protein [Rhizomicrobium sp.]|nr:DUF3291 domain-containing protein [Rhizomicrobium sp.]
MHLAQLNIGKLKGGKDDPAMAGFFDNLDRISAVAERMPGFVWRLKDDSGNATSIPWVGDASIVANLTVWESVETLEKFVWQTVHTRIYHRKGEFFEKMQTPHFVMWWIAAGHIPTLEEGKERLDHLTVNGPSEFAFGWETAPAARLWQDKRCA